MKDKDNTKEELIEELVALRKQAGEALQDSGEKFRLIAETISEVFWMTDVSSGKIFYVSPAYEKVWKRTIRSLNENPSSFIDAIHPEDRVRVLVDFETIKTGVPVEGEYRIVWPDGSIRWICDRGFPVCDKSGQCTHYVGIARDITERKKAENMLSLQYKIVSILAENNELDKTLKETIKTICEHIGWELGDVWYLDRDADLLRLGEMWYADFLDGSELEALNRKMVFKCGEGILGLVWQKGEPIWIEDLSAYSHLPRARIVAGMGFKSAFAFPVTAAGAVNGVMVATGRTMSQPDTDLLNSLTAISSQIGGFIEHKRAEALLHKSEAKYRTLLDNLPQRIFLKDRDSVYLSCNMNYARDLKLMPDEIIGKSCRDFYPAELAEKYISDDKRIMDSGKTEEFDESYILEGREITVHTVKTPVKDNKGNIVGILGIFWDVTEQKRLENELLRMQRLESLGVLAGGIAHDFNNLLSGVLGNISLAKMYLKPEDRAYKRLEEAEKASVRTKDLTGQLLTFAKGGEPVRKVISVAGLLKDSVSFALSGSRISCEQSIPDDCWPVNVDEGQIHQVINNLLINADQAMPQGGTIEIQCKNTEINTGDALPLDNGSYVKVSIKDQGIGIPEPLLKRIFDPYFTTKEKGRGLGLATSYSILKRHNGLITVESKENTGITFHIYLPALPSAAISRESSEERIMRGKGRVLVMDDEEIVRQVAGEMLKALGYEVESAIDGIEAIKKYADAKEKGEPFNIVIMDLTIPGGMGGKEAIIRLKEIDPDVRAIVASGYSNDPVISDFRGFGFLGSLTKPYRIEELSKTMHRVINAYGF